MTAPTEDNIVEQLVFRIIPNGRLLRTWQLNGGISARLHSLYQKLPDFQRLLTSYDPQGKFRNPFLDTSIFGA